MTEERPDRSGLRISRRRALAVGGAAALSLVSAGRIPVVGDLPTAVDADGATGGEDGASLRRLSEAGITGEGVRVAVLDPTGFDPNHPDLAGAVDEIRQFGAESAVVDGTSHGTAAAASVAEVAPDVSLSLASFRRTPEFVGAIEWARRREVDAVLAPVAAHGTAATPQSGVFRAARRAVESGTVIVAPTGNAALGHWEGPYAALDGEGSARRRLRVRPLPGRESVSGRFRAWLVTEAAVGADLTLALLRSVDGGRRWNLVALARAADSRTGKRLTADLDGDEYALVVRPSGRGGPGDADLDPTGRVAVTTPTHALASPRPLGSIAAPASVPGVVGVGVTDADHTSETPQTDASGDRAGTQTETSGDGTAGSPPAADAAESNGVAPYSGRGPTARGDIGVDVVAPPRPWIADGGAGTSAAAARTAGAAALILDVAPDFDPSDVAGVLRASAGDVGRPGRDLVSGSGRLDVVAAVQRARSR